MSRPVGFDDTGRMMYGTNNGQVTYDEDPYEHLPHERRGLARLLERLGATFEETSWPATWNLWGRTSHHVQAGDDLYICLSIDRFEFGIEWPSDRHQMSHTEQWQDIIVNAGPLSIILHHWWITTRG